MVWMNSWTPLTVVLECFCPAGLGGRISDNKGRLADIDSNVGHSLKL